MESLKNEKCVVLEFSSVESVKNKKTRDEIKFNAPCIVEISAVKIENGEISDNFTRFFAIEGYDPRDIELEETDINNHGVRAAHLIGAKTLKEELGRLSSFLADSILVMRGQYIDCEFKYLKAFARGCGVEWNNATVNLTELLQAFNLKSNLFSGESYENASPMEIAQYLTLDCNTWADLFIQNEVDFDPTREVVFNCRDDILSWALAIAQLYINLYEDLYPNQESTYKRIDENGPF